MCRCLARVKYIFPLWIPPSTLVFLAGVCAALPVPQAVAPVNFGSDTTGEPMTKLLICIAVLACTTALAQQTTYSNLDDKNDLDPGGGTYGWGWCTFCAGGQNEDTASIWTAPFQTTPSRDGSSRQFHISGLSYANGLWWYKVGPNDNVSNFRFDFWVQLDSGTKGAQAIEFDVFQYVGSQRFMFGTQCNYFYGVWDIWDEASTRWLRTSVPCSSLKPNVWYHVTETFHRTADTKQHYDSLTVVQYNNRNKVVSNKSYTLNLTTSSGPLPSGWSENMGVQFQMDIGPNGTTMNEWVDRVNLTVW